MNPLQLGTTQTGIIDVLPKDENGNPIAVTDIASVVGSSSDPAVATVGPHVGFPTQLVISPLKEGSVTITVTCLNLIGTTITNTLQLQIVAVATSIELDFSAH